MNALKSRNRYSRFAGYMDDDGHFVPFTHADEALQRSRKFGVRTLLRLVLNNNGQLEGMLYTNEKSLTTLLEV